jgi:aspartate racemase
LLIYQYPFASKNSGAYFKIYIQEMKRIGLVGGMSWQSTEMYYKYINEYVENKKSGLASAEILLSSINFSEIERFQKDGKWNEAEKIICKEIERLTSAGADFIGVCSNTGNECISRLKEKMNIPVFHDD